MRFFGTHFLVLHFAASALAATSWTFSIPTASSGAFTAAESTTSSTVLGTYSRLSNGFIEMTVTGGTGANVPSNGTVKHALEIPGFAFFSQPLLTNEKRIIVTVSVGVCPTTSFTGILGYSIWAGTAGTSTDVSNAAVPAFGVFTWNPATNQATISDLRNLTSYATLGGFASFVLGGTCTNGVITFSGAGDRGGQFYVTNTQGGVYITNTNRLILVMPQKSIPAASNLNGTYSVFDYDESFHTNTFATRMTIAGGTTATGDRLSDISLDTADTAQSWTMSSISTNSPINGVFTASISLEGSASRNCACATFFRNRTTIFCVAQSPYDDTRPMNFIMVSDSAAFSGGSLDTYGFGTGIQVNTIAGGADFTNSIRLQSDGKIVAGGYDRQDFAAVRYLADGSLDTSFSSDGKVVTNVLAGAQDRATAASIDSTGRIIISGYEVSAASADNLAIVRYLSDGTLDTAFSTDGIVTFTLGANDERIQNTAVQSDDKIVFGGYYNNGANNDFLVGRVTTAGSLDTTFSTDGWDAQNVGGGGTDQGMGIAIQGDNKIVVAGWNNSNMATIRYNTDGTLDNNYGSSGTATANYWSGVDRANNVTLQPDGKVVAVGWASPSGSEDFAIIRLLSDGSLDTSFATTGKVAVTFDATTNDRAESVAVTTDGKLVVVGWVNNATTSDIIAVAKLSSDGSLDTSFDGDGMYTYDHGTGSDKAFSVAIQPDEKIVVGGIVNNTNADHVVLRLWP